MRWLLSRVHAWPAKFAGLPGEPWENVCASHPSGVLPRSRVVVGPSLAQHAFSHDTIESPSLPAFLPLDCGPSTMLNPAGSPAPVPTNSMNVTGAPRGVSLSTSQSTGRAIANRGLSRCW